MIKRFDHAVIGVRDLDRALALYRDVLGLDAGPGGRHTGRGTHNGIVRFGLDYLELLSVYDEAEARAAGPTGAVMADFLAGREGGLVGFALATNDIESLAKRFRRTGLEAVGPFAMERARPDGRVLKWRLLVPGGVSWRRPWPFFIQWDLPDAERLEWERPGTHPVGATGVAGVAVAVHDLEWARNLYGRQFGLPEEPENVVADLAARRVRYRLGGFAIDVLAPTGEGPVASAIAAAGEGVFQVTLSVRDVDQAQARLAGAGVQTQAAPGRPGGQLIPPAAVLGARLALAPGNGGARTAARNG